MGLIQYAARWVGWRMTRPMVDATDYPDFKRKLEQWKRRKPRRR